MAALWVAATHPERVTSLVIVNGTARVGAAEDYDVGVPEEVAGDAANIEVPLTDEGVPRDIAIFAPSLAHRVGFQEWWGRAARRGASPATATAFNLVTFSADVRLVPPRRGVPDARDRPHRHLRQPRRARSLPGRAHRRCPLRDLPRPRPAAVGRRVRLHPRRDGGVRHRRPRRARSDASAGHRAVHRHRRLDRAGGRRR